MIKLGSNLPADQIVLAIANGDIARVVENQKHDGDVVHGTDGEFLNRHHEISVPDNAHNRRIEFGQLGADSGGKRKSHRRKRS